MKVSRRCPEPNAAARAKSPLLNSIYLCREEISTGDIPSSASADWAIAPDAGRCSELVQYVGLDKLRFAGGVTGEGAVAQDQAIRMLVGMATDHFGTAQTLLMEQMK